MPIGSSCEDLSPSLPLLPNIADELVQAATHPTDDIAYALAACAGYAYSDADTVAMMMTQMGLCGNHCAEIALSDDAMFIDSTAYLVQSEDGRVVILCYKGTSPGNFTDWLLDADIDPDRISLTLTPDGVANPAYWVHSGFYRNVQATRRKVVKALDRALRGESVLDDGGPMPNSMKALYLTGHSMGGAMAALMALLLHVDPARRDMRAKLRAVYTFGQPMVGPPALAEFWRQSGPPPLIRYVYERDVVPHAPPRDSGLFEHFGAEYQYQGGTWKPPSPPITQVNLAEFAVLTPSDFVTSKIAELRGLTTAWNGLARRFDNLPPVRLASSATRRLPFGDAFVRLPLVYSIEDHSPNNYISRLAPEGIMSEFGDGR